MSAASLKRSDERKFFTVENFQLMRYKTSAEGEAKKDE